MPIELLLSVPGVVAMVNLVKPFIPGRYLPLLAVAFGALFAFMFMIADWRTTLAQGVIIGLSAAGLYDLRTRDAQPAE